MNPATALELFLINSSLAKSIFLTFNILASLLVFTSLSPLTKAIHNLPSVSNIKALTHFFTDTFKYAATSSIVFKSLVNSSFISLGSSFSPSLVINGVTSMFEEKSQLSHNTTVSSPISVIAWNSSDKSPPITPVSALTIL